MTINTTTTIINGLDDLSHDELCRLYIQAAQECQGLRDRVKELEQQLQLPPEINVSSVGGIGLYNQLGIMYRRLEKENEQLHAEIKILEEEIKEMKINNGQYGVGA